MNYPLIWMLSSVFIQCNNVLRPEELSFKGKVKDFVRDLISSIFPSLVQPSSIVRDNEKSSKLNSLIKTDLVCITKKLKKNVNLYNENANDKKIIAIKGSSKINTPNK